MIILNPNASTSTKSAGIFFPQYLLIFPKVIFPYVHHMVNRNMETFHNHQALLKAEAITQSITFVKSQSP